MEPARRKIPEFAGIRLAVEGNHSHSMDESNDGSVLNFFPPRKHPTITSSDSVKSDYMNSIARAVVHGMQCLAEREWIRWGTNPPFEG